MSNNVKKIENDLDEALATTTPTNATTVKSSEVLDERELIMVVDDSATNRNILSHILKQLDFQVIASNNGKEAWAKILELRSEKKRIHGIISDIMMPEVDGLTLLNQIREDRELCYLRFILITATADRKSIEEAKKLKVNGYLLKPVSFDRVKAKMKEIFPLKRFPISLPK